MKSPKRNAPVSGRASVVDPTYAPLDHLILFMQLALLFEEGRSNGRSMDDFPSPAFFWGAGLLALLLLAIGPALDGAGFAKAAGVPVLMAAWAAAVVLIDRWAARR
jgi:hypothetical protein